MRKVSNKEREKLSAKIAGLESLDLHHLRIRWKLLYEIEAPPHLSRDWLRRAVAYRMQENVLGGLKPATRRLLKRVSEDARTSKRSKVVTTRKVGPNTILIREWGGTRHEVTVVENGAMFRGKRYRSLGDADITFPVESNAGTIDEIIAELEATRIPERSGRAMDHESEDAFERLRKAGKAGRPAEAVQ